MKYRHELKFEVSNLQIELLHFQLRTIMRADEHQADKFYTVRSLYFDDLYNTCMQENEDGTDRRYKYRIRIYNGTPEVIKLEKKEKFRNMTQKTGVPISAQKCRSYMNGLAPPLSEDTGEVEKELYCAVKMRGMKPKSIVEYDRTAYIDPKGNVRITFDKNIRGSRQVHKFLDEKMETVPLLPSGVHVLEVKYDEILPEYLVEILGNGSLQRTSFSKYYYSRNCGGERA